MAFHQNQHNPGNNMMFPNRRQSQGLNPNLGQGLNPVNTFAPLGSLGPYNTRQFDPSGFDSRGYLNPSDPWKNNNSIFQQDNSDGSPNLQNSLLHNGGHPGLSSMQGITPPSSGYPPQTLRMMHNNDAQLPYFNQGPLASTSQQTYSNYQQAPASSNGQSQAMSVAHMAPQSPDTSFIRRYSGNTSMMGGIDPSSLTNGMGYSNQGYTNQLGGMDSFGRNALSQYVDSENSNQELKPKADSEFQYNSHNSTNHNNNGHGLGGNANSVANESHLQVDHSIDTGYGAGVNQNANNHNLNPGMNQNIGHGVPHNLGQNMDQGMEKHTQPLASIQHSTLSQSQFPGIGALASAQTSVSQMASSPSNIKPKELIQPENIHESEILSSPSTQFRSGTQNTSIKPRSPKTPKSKSKNLKMTPPNTTPSGQKLKRPMNAFLIYASERRPQLQQADPTMTTAAQSKILGDEWAKMDESRKLEYVERARTLKTEFLETNPDYVYTRRPNNTKKKYRRRSAGDDSSSKLKRPMNAYLIFNKEMRHRLLETNPNMSVAEISKEIGDRWKSLSEVRSSI
ncbi:High mobility group, variant 2 [Basidiobolus ranarum]|uniref:High mobility group, variant 2 n=1 Tax=Basidiobolus ranarum TaxID=34480 RepID=A0ABR2W590_9FUNG